MSDVASRSRALLILTGAVIGLAWAAGLRGWMIQMAGAESEFHWYGTFVLLLTPGVLVGASIALAEHRRRSAGPRSRWLTLSPCLFLAALADPTIFRALVSNGTGGGAIGVVLFGLAGGYGLSGRGRTWWRRTCAALAVLGILLMLVVASDHLPLHTAHGAWVAVYASSLLAVLCLACAIPQRIGRPSLVPTRWMAVAVGTVCGLAWGAALRGFMWEVAGDEAAVTWTGTFLWVLLPAAVIGGVLGGAEFRRRTGPLAHRSWAIWSPMLFAAVLVHNPFDLVSAFMDGVGLSAIAVPAMCMLGGYAIGGRGPHWVRGLCGLVILSAVPAWSLTATKVGGPSLSVGTPHGAWAAVLLWGLFATFAMAAAIPHRTPSSTPAGALTGPRVGTHLEVRDPS